LTNTVKTQAKTLYVSVSDAGFAPTTELVPQGSTVQWNMVGPSANGVADGNALALFDSGTHAAPYYQRFTYTAAGVYKTVDKLSHTQTVNVLPKASPTSATTGTTFTITWATITAPTGYVYDVQMLKPGGAWQNWLLGTTSPSATYVPTISGTYKFRARLHKVSPSTATGFATVAITVT